MTRPPVQIGKYEIVRRLGHGGMGTVYLARDPDLDRLIAIKVLHDSLLDEELLQRFFREARAAANLRHNNIITVYEVGQDEHQPFIAIEYVDGLSLADVIRSRQPLILGDRLSYIEQICSGLHYAHCEGLVHRDIKPANVMVDRRGVIRILDFGIARIQGSGMTRDGAMIGTLNYMSPEQMLGRPVDYRSDIFAVGAVAYELLAYRQAFAGSIEDGLLHRLPHEAPPSLEELCPGVPGALVRVVTRALAKRPEDRFANLDEARAAIREIRRNLEPEIDDTIVSRRGRPPGVPSSTPDSPSERRELLERRARQIAVHRDAAQAAFAGHDVDNTVAAGENALTLDSDDAETLQRDGEIQRAKQARDQESQERHTRDRTVRQQIDDADRRLSRGDLSGAFAALQPALAVDPQNPLALALLSRLNRAAAMAGTVLQGLRAGEVEGASGLGSGQTVTDVQHAFQPTLIADRAALPSPSSRGVRASRSRPAALLTVLVVVVCGAIAAGVLWMTLNDDRQTSGPPSPGGPPPVETPLAETTSPLGATPPTAEPPTTTILDPPAPPVNPDNVVQGRLDRVNAAYESGNLSGALALIEPLLNTSADTRVRDRARLIARSAFQLMDAAEAAAVTQKAPSLAADALAAANRSRLRADQALTRSEYVEAGRQALAAEVIYRRAEGEARLAAAERIALPPSAPTPAPPAPVVVVAQPPLPSPPVQPPVATNVSPPVATNVPPPVATNATPSNTPAPTAVTPPTSLVDRERSGILRVLNRYQEAYRNRSVKALQDVYPSLPRETGQKLDRAFRDCRDYDVTFGNMQVSMGDDPTSATVNVRTTYTCQPRSAQPAQPASVQDVFLLRKVADTWLIDRTGVLDTSR